MNDQYRWKNSSDTTIIVNTNITFLNPYLGGAFQQATSAVTTTSEDFLSRRANGRTHITTDQDCYELMRGCFSVYGFEYKSGKFF